ncbi:MAG: DUF6544 family protein [Chloroflexota bacterium]
MGTIGTVGKVIVGLGVGALGALAGIKVMDDRRVERIWRSLDEEVAAGEPFAEGMVSDLPDPARRYFLHAIRPGTPLASKIRLGISGSLRTGRDQPWMSLSAEQIVAKGRGFIWKARASSGPMVLTAADHYAEGEGRTRVALFGLLPIVNSSGPDVSRSAIGRLAIEGVLLPPSLLPQPGVKVEGVDGDHFRVTVTVDGESTPMTLAVDQDGRLREVVIPRYGNMTEDGSFQYIPFGAAVEEERTFGGYTIPGKMRAGWWYGTDRYAELFHFDFDWAEFA